MITCLIEMLDLPKYLSLDITKVADSQRVCHVIYIFFEFSSGSYNCFKVHYCRICVTDFRKRVIFPPPIREQPRKDPS